MNLKKEFTIFILVIFTNFVLVGSIISIDNLTEDLHFFDYNNDYTGKNILVAVIDSGLDPKYSDLAEKVVSFKDFVNPSNIDLKDYITKGERKLHGTKVSAILASDKKEDIFKQPARGVAPDVGLLSIAILNETGHLNNDFSLENALNFTLHYSDNQYDKVDIVNLSLFTYILNPNVSALVDQLLDKNITIIVGAGNNGSFIQDFWQIDGIASHTGVLTVGAYDPYDSIVAEYSQIGGVNPFASQKPSYKPDIVAPGSNLPILEYYSGQNDKGTSLSTPYVSGIVAQLLEQRPNLTPDQIKWLLRHSTIDLRPQDPDQYSGFGLLNQSNVFEINEKFDSTLLYASFYVIKYEEVSPAIYLELTQSVNTPTVTNIILEFTNDKLNYILTTNADQHEMTNFWFDRPPLQLNITYNVTITIKNQNSVIKEIQRSLTLEFSDINERSMPQVFNNQSKKKFIEFLLLLINFIFFLFILAKIYRFLRYKIS